MNPKYLDSMEVCRRLSAACKEAGGQKDWAEMHGVSPAYVSSVLHARIEPGQAILSALGLAKIVRYVEKPKNVSAQ